MSLILVACEESASLSSQLAYRGHNVLSCDLQRSSGEPDVETDNYEQVVSLLSLLTDNHGYHIHFVGNVFAVLKRMPWDFLFGFPPCTYLCKAQLWDKTPERVLKRQVAVRFFEALLKSGIPRIALENPAGLLTRALRPPDQIVQPWQFGDYYRKEICLWTVGLPPLVKTVESPVRKSVSNHTNSRMSQAERSRIRSSWRFYPRMIDAICDQWFSNLACAVLVYPQFALLTSFV
jgi:hypothetical protein